ncbi:hypothetical protein [Gimesia maris]|uniref:hypothetical protein n=1 Tax=Gimesia maris TaxID=122 RepID=UPI00241D2F0D|nr:hypothetical protein [Gimesia maris]
MSVSIRFGEPPFFATAIPVLAKGTPNSELGTSTQSYSVFTPQEQRLAEELLQAAQQKQ